MKEKKVIISEHAKESIKLRGTSEEEVKLTIFESDWETVRDGRLKAEKNFPFNNVWYDKWYSVKRVKVIFIDDPDEITVVTTITFYF
jgi:hypothetical protein